MKRKNLYSNISQNLENKNSIQIKYNILENIMLQNFNEDTIYYLEGVSPEEACTSEVHLANFKDLEVTEDVTLGGIIEALQRKGVTPTMNEVYERFPLETQLYDIYDLDFFDYDLFDNVVLAGGYILNNSIEIVSM